MSRPEAALMKSISATHNNKTHFTRNASSLHGAFFISKEVTNTMKKNLFKRGMAGLLSLVMCLTALVGIGTTTAYAAGERAEVYLVSFPRSGDANIDYSGTWGHPNLRYMNGWHSGESKYTTVTFGSNKTVWWKGACGHEWQTSIKARSAGEQCPICSGARVLRGYNDFESKFPELAKEWSPKNEPLRPSMITAATHRKVIWQCKLGHEWTASVKSRTVNGTGCPYCSHNFVLPGFNDLASRFPEIAAEWSERNLPLTPDQVTAFKNIKVWWKCRLGHEWNTLISTRAGGSQCPYCSGIKLLKGFNDLKTKYPSLAIEWSDKNLPLTPDAVNEKSTKNVWWKCRTCGYEWKAVVKARVKGGMCPVCAERAVLQGYNDLGTTDPHLLSEWDYEKNSKWTPSNVSRNSMKVVWWKCGAGHSYRAKIADRTIEQKGCPQCEAEFQQALPQMLIMMYGAQNGITVKSNSDSELGMRLVAYLPELHCAVDIAGATVTEKREQSVKAHICQSNRLGYYLIKRTADASQMAAEIKTLFIRNHIYLHTDSEKDVQVLRERFLEWKYRNACKLNGKY